MQPRRCRASRCRTRGSHAVTGGAPVADDWLATFDDPRLNALVEEALANNPDLKVAAARVEQAAAYVEAAGSTMKPQVSAIGNISGKNASSGALNFGGVFASWELDLWGQVRSGREAARMQLLSAELSDHYARQSMAAMVARAWFLATEARLQKGVADDMVVAAQKLVDLAKDRRRVGVGNDYDVSVAEASLATYRDAATQLDLSFRQSVQAIETLIGRYPAAELDVPAALPALPGPVPAGLPSELLERRPDVIAAERRVAAAFYRVEETKAARLPTISLTGSFSSLSSDLVVLKQRDNPVWGFGGRATVPLYLGGALQAAGEGPHCRAEGGRRRVRQGRRQRLCRRGESALGRLRARCPQAPARAGRDRERAGAGVRRDPLSRRLR